MTSSVPLSVSVAAFKGGIGNRKLPQSGEALLLTRQRFQYLERLRWLLWRSWRWRSASSVEQRRGGGGLERPSPLREGKKTSNTHAAAADEDDAERL